ncbi:MULTISPECIES: DOPA 4,5-dioxygenase family protein [unclassified Neptuniibacter]|uniref:DOPA 4,5-dioxygenase family protein n=1 Tax=unclassified Neptuniibacter TaxID=2630693 RepID=UPI0026E33BF2|nr:MULTISPECIES: DOPA 4,5-dioxygenase family protein [unclassified Neptuniibacter]MDO6513337.1 DOPA 4,5-dioxygenase family protein [Neptuniibacter sp. 2_MG-2023]MDO6595206.1 DOPA 4,5-dioxygenase family protein [Neptuniibacter sp. 1_MG-2023]
MTEIKRPINSHKAYHAHIYFDDASKVIAQTLCEELGVKFNLKVGRFHESPIGPHPCGSCQITFGARTFETFITWLDENRKGLTVLVHGVTGDDFKDHTEFAYWLGQPVELSLGFFENT